IASFPLSQPDGLRRISSDGKAEPALTSRFLGAVQQALQCGTPGKVGIGRALAAYRINETAIDRNHGRAIDIMPFSALQIGDKAGAQTAFLTLEAHFQPAP